MYCVNILFCLCLFRTYIFKICRLLINCSSINIKLIETVADDFMMSQDLHYVEGPNKKTFVEDDDKVLQETWSMWASTEKLIARRKSKKSFNEHSEIKQLLAKNVESATKIQNNINKCNRYTMDDSLTKLSTILNISTKGILAVVDAVKENMNNKIVFFEMGRWITPQLDWAHCCFSSSLPRILLSLGVDYLAEILL